MKLKTNQIPAFIKSPDPKTPLVLVYGPDQGLVHERGEIIAKTVCADLTDAFQVSDLRSDAIAEEPSKLFEEVQAQSMFGGRRVVRVRDASDDIADTILQILKDIIDPLIVLEAGDLGPKSKLRQTVEHADNAVTIPCYTADERDLTTTLKQNLQQRGLQIDRDALLFLSGSVVGDRSWAKQAIEKLDLYMLSSEEKTIQIEDVIAAIGNSADYSLDDLTMAVTSGDFNRADRVLQRLMREGIAEILILRSLHRHLQRIDSARLEQQAGKSIDQAMQSLKPPVFFKQKNQFSAQMSLWTDAKLQRAIEMILTAEIRCKSNGYDPTVILSRLIFELSCTAQPGLMAA